MSKKKRGRRKWVFGENIKKGPRIPRKKATFAAKVAEKVFSSGKEKKEQVLDKVLPHSMKVVQLKIFCEGTDNPMGTATAFLATYKENLFLITNHHVVSGYYPGSKRILHKSRIAVPGRMEMYCRLVKEKGDGSGEWQYETAHMGVDFGQNGMNGWLEHPELASKCDIVAIPVDTRLYGDFEGFGFNSIDIEAAIESELDLNVMDELFITGFPLPIDECYSKLPIYKAGYLASEPGEYANTILYVDSKTKPGMSGSPVIQRERVRFENKDGGVLITERVIKFVGVYSGRVGVTDIVGEAELGIVWPFQEYLVPILENGKKTKR